MRNLGKCSEISLSDFIVLVQKHAEKKALVKMLPNYPDNLPYECADVHKEHNLLGYKGLVS